VRVPEGAGNGKATVTLSFPAWKEGDVAPATFAVSIEEPPEAQAKVEKPQKATPISASKEEIRFDPKTCVRGNAGLGFGLGGVRSGSRLRPPGKQLLKSRVLAQGGWERRLGPDQRERIGPGARAAP
jgi:hypothetical protein